MHNGIQRKTTTNVQSATVEKYIKEMFFEKSVNKSENDRKHKQGDYGGRLRTFHQNLYSQIYDKSCHYDNMGTIMENGSKMINICFLAPENREEKKYVGSSIHLPCK